MFGKSVTLPRWTCVLAPVGTCFAGTESKEAQDPSRAVLSTERGQEDANYTRSREGTEIHEIIKMQGRTGRDLRHLLVHSSRTVALGLGLPWRLWRRNWVTPCLGVLTPVGTYTGLCFLRKSFLWKQGLTIVNFSLILDSRLFEASEVPKSAA